MAAPIFRLTSMHPAAAQYYNNVKFTIPKTSTSRFLCCCASPDIHSEPVEEQVSLSLCVGSYVLPHPKKVERGGEDALFVSSYNGGVIAVADGVSGWAEQNVDPSLFARQLMANASRFLQTEEVNYDPRILIRKAHAATYAVGSATVIVAMLERDGTLKIANVGDCGLRVIRQGRIIFSTTPQEHYFDCPYQLSSEAVGQTYLDAKVSSVKLVEGDLLVMGSDGLFDNTFDDEIVATVANISDVTTAAKALADLASNHSTDSNFDSPYTMEARAKGLDVPMWKKILGMKLIGMALSNLCYKR
ncbi:hypothetical protein ACFE04_015209 [Oxalis oulophora]